jgi:GNAT superfamily N-acetyltransferase
MEDPEWELRRADLIARIMQMPPAIVTLRDGDDLRIEAAIRNYDSAELIHRITREAFEEFRGFLDPPNGSDFETPEVVATQMLKGVALIGYVSGAGAASLRITLNPDHLYIGRVGVVPRMRCKGIGRAMIHRAELIAAHLQLPEVRLGAREKLTDNVALYLKLGYTIDRVMPHPRGPDNVVLFLKRVEPHRT